MWRTLEADGCTWEVRILSSEGQDPDHDVLEFRPREATRPPRRFVMKRSDLDQMTEEALRAAYLQARPIGGDFYGRPGKRMPDAT